MGAMVLVGWLVAGATVVAMLNVAKYSTRARYERRSRR